MRDYSFFSYNDFTKLAAVKKSPMISIFIPTHRAGEEVQQNHDAIQLKSILQEVENNLKHHQLKAKTIKKMLQPAYALLDDSGYWHKLSDGIALFIADEFFEHYEVPVWFESFYEISHQFYLKPLIPIFNNDGKFFLLPLSFENARLFEASHHALQEIEISDIVKEAIDITTRFENKSDVQFRSATENKVMYHGENRTEKEEIVIKFFRKLDEGIRSVIGKNSHPLVLACRNSIYHLFKSVTSYDRLHNKFIDKNPFPDFNLFLLHERAWKLIEPHFTEHRNTIRKKFSLYLSKNKAYTQIEDIIRASIEGRIKVLFLQNRQTFYGRYNPDDRKTEPLDKENPASADLLNTAVINTLLNGGEAYLMEPEKMPVKNTVMNAILRY
jgi:hypothetical protein